MRTFVEYDDVDYEKLIKAVIDSRLLFTTKEYIAKHIGYDSLQSQSVGKVLQSSFLQKCVFQGLREEVAYMTDGDIDLLQFLESYKEASDFYNSKRRMVFFKEEGLRDNLFKLLEIVYLYNKIPEEGYSKKELELFKYIYNDEQDTLKIDVILLTMIAMKVLPPYGEGGDFGSTHETPNSDCEKLSIEESYNIMYNFLTDHIKKDDYFSSIIPLEMLSTITKQTPGSKDKNEKYRGIPVMNRISLYWSVGSVFAAVDTAVNPEKAYRLVMAKKQEQLFPDISGIWCKDREGLMTKYWKIKEEPYGFKVELCQKNGEYEQAELYLYDYTGLNCDDNRLAELKFCSDNFRKNLYQGFLATSHTIETLLDGNDDGQDDTVHFICRLFSNEANQIYKIAFYPISITRNNILPTVLYRQKEMSELAVLDKQIEQNGRKVNIGLEYYVRKCLAAMSAEYLYLAKIGKDEICSEEPVLDCLKCDKFYKVPRWINRSFVEMGMDGDIAVVYAKKGGQERYYIGSPNTLDYYDVTTPKKMEENGIEIVDSIRQDEW